MDNGPEFISHKRNEWAKENDVELVLSSQESQYRTHI